MNVHLVVVRPFGGLARGDLVVEASRISDILGSEHAANVVRVCVPDASEKIQQVKEGEG